MKRWIPDMGVRAASVVCALAALAVAGVAGTMARPEAAPVAAPTIIAAGGGPSPDADAGPSLPDACSRRVGCLLR